MNKKYKNKQKNTKKAIATRDEIFKFLISLDDYKKDSDLKKLKETEVQKIRNDLAKQIIDLSKRFNLPLTKEFKTRYCKKCSSFLTEGKNKITRINKSRIIRKCLVCGSIRRIPLVSKKRN